MLYADALFVLFTFSLLPNLNLSADLCDSQSVTNITSYKYKNVPVQNCHCPYKTHCIRKCCGVGFYASKGVCIKNEKPDFVLHIPVYNKKSFVRNVSANNGILAGVMNCDFFLYIQNPTEWFYLQENGKLFTSTYGELSNDHYCVDHVKDKGLGAFICYDKTDTSRKIYAAGMIISMPFLLATFIAYALMPDRNLHMKALMFYVITLLLSYLLLVIIQLTDGRFSEEVCMGLGYFCLLFFLVSFFWINVICIDIWFTFSGYRGLSGSKKKAERRRFLIYCAYAWGVPIAHVCIVYIIDTNITKNSYWRPGIGEGQCFLRRGLPELLYFYGPMAVLLIMNIIFFIITAFKIRSLKKDTIMLKKEDSRRHSYENDKQTYKLYLKLLFAMGVNWSMEIISWVVLNRVKDAPESIWYITDFCNAIYGVFIFFIFVFKRSIWKLLQKRYYSFIGKPHLAHSMTLTNTTRATSYSTTNSSGHEHGHQNDTSNLTSEA